MSELPPEVIDAANRLQRETKDDTNDHMPGLFREIIKNHEAVDEIINKGDTMSQKDWRVLKELNRDMEKNLRPAAEAFVRGTPGDRPNAVGHRYLPGNTG